MNKRNFLKCIGVALAAPSVAVAKEDEYTPMDVVDDGRYMRMLCRDTIREAEDDGVNSYIVKIGRNYEPIIKRYFNHYKADITKKYSCAGSIKWGYEFFYDEGELMLKVEKVC